MKKIFKLMTIFLLLISVTACAKKEEETNINNNEQKEEIDVEEKDEDIIASESIKDPTTKNPINLNKYLIVKYEGYNGGGRVSVYLDKEKFYLDNIQKINFKNESSKNAYYALTNSKSEPIDIFWNYINKLIIEKADYLSNGDTITINWGIDDEQISNYFSFDFVYSKETRRVFNLVEPEKFNPMDYVEAYYEGTAPWGNTQIKINIDKVDDSAVSKRIKSAISLYNYTIENKKINNPGEKITITYSKVDLSDKNKLGHYISQYGLIPTETKKIYTLNNFQYHPKDIYQISDTIFTDSDEFIKNHFNSLNNIKCHSLELISFKKVKSYYRTPLSYNSYYSDYSTYKFYIIYEVNVKAKYESHEEDDSFFENMTYYFVVYYDSVVYNKDGKFSYSEAEKWAGMESVVGKYYKIDGVLLKEHQKPQHSYAEYYFIADGYNSLKKVEEDFKSSSSNYKIEERNY